MDDHVHSMNKTDTAPHPYKGHSKDKKMVYFQRHNLTHSWTSSPVSCPCEGLSCKRLFVLSGHASQLYLHSMGSITIVSCLSNGLSRTESYITKAQKTGMLSTHMTQLGAPRWLWSVASNPLMYPFALDVARSVMVLEYGSSSSPPPWSTIPQASLVPLIRASLTPLTCTLLTATETTMQLLL